MKFVIAFAILASCAGATAPQPDSETLALIIAGTAGGQSWSLAGETVTFNNCIQDSCYNSHLTLTSCNSQLSSGGDRKSTRLNSSHGYISYAVFCLKKK